MQKAIKIGGIILLVLVALVASVPFLFKDKLKVALNREIEKNVDAKVNYGSLSLNLWRHFPDLTVNLSDLSVVGLSPFTGDTLVSANEVSLSVNLLSVWRGKQIKVNHIGLNQPHILVKILKDSSANYAIYESVSKADTAKSAFSVGVQSWQISDGRVVYDDRLTNTLIKLENVNQTGEGDLTQDIVEVLSDTKIENANISYGGVNYLNNKKISLATTTTLDLLASKYDFKNTTLTINEFPLQLSGSVVMPDTNIYTDIHFKALSDDFKQFFSIVPGAYTQNYSDVEATGKIGFDGEVIGIYNSRQFPAFLVNLNVKDGHVQYPDLPKPLEQIDIAATIKNTTDQLANTSVDVKNLSFLLGNNPVKGRALIEGLKRMKVDADFVAKINLEEITKVIPLPGQTLRGLADINLKAKGVYDGQRQFPIVSATANLTNGYVKSDQFAEPLENVTFKGSLVNTNGNINDTRLNISDLRWVLQQEAFEAKGTVSNFADYNWDIEGKGKIDLGKITAIFPIEKTKIDGKITTDIRTKGKMSDLKAKRYAALNTVGQASIANLEYVTPDYPAMKVQTAELDFTPQKINVTNAVGTVGSSDFATKGQFTNYLGYILNDEAIVGDFTVSSRSFNVNEWLTDSPTAATDSIHKSVVVVPKNIQLTLHPTVQSVLYDKMKMKNLGGTLTVQDGTIKMNNVVFGALGGQFITNGSYDSRDLARPQFDFGLDLTKIDIGEAYQHLAIVRALTPIAAYLIGQVSSKIRVKGLLQQDMLPNINTLTGDGLIKVIEGAFKDNNAMLDQVADYTKISDIKRLRLKDVLMNVSVEDGKLTVAPYEIIYQDYKMAVSGKTGLNGSVDFKLAFDVPSGKVGAGFSQAFAGWTGKALTNTERVKFDLSMTGTYQTPKLAFNGSSTAKNLKETVVTEAKQQVQVLTQAAEDRISIEKERLRKEAEARIKAAQDSLNAVIEAKKREAESRAKDFVKEQKKKLLDKIFGPKKPVTDSTEKQK